MIWKMIGYVSGARTFKRPDLFASKVSAVSDAAADAAISNVTGSNAVNVFLGVGTAWSLAAFYHAYHGIGAFYVESGSLAFSVTL